MAIRPVTGVPTPFVPGAEVVLPLTSGQPLRGRLNLVRQAGAGWQLAGELVGLAGSFSLTIDAETLEGRILLPTRQLAYELVRAGAKTVIRERPLGEVICFPMPREPLAAAAPPVAAALVPALSSRPSATAVLYMDFDGAVVTDPDWNGGTPIIAAPSPLSAVQITEVWNRVKEDFLPFNVDVTTDPARYAAAPVGRRMRCIITPSYSWYGPVGGVAYLHSFRMAGTNGFNPDLPCWVFNGSVVGVAEAVSHEFGHTLGLRHDGRSSPRESYFLGHGSGPGGWAPIMGAGYYQPITHWSKGEYRNADNLEDDLAIISNVATNGFGVAPDEAGDTRATAAALGLTAGAFNVSGVISSASDVDFYGFTVGLKGLSATVNVAGVAPNLDVRLELQDAAGTILSASDPDASQGASFTFIVPGGSYFLKVQGVGRGDASSDGYSSYGSLGAYTLVGEVSDPPTIATHPASQTAVLGANVSLAVVATSTATVSYQWFKNGRLLENGGNVSGATTATLAVANIQKADAGNYSVRVSTFAGSATSSIATVAVIGPPEFVVRPLSRFAVAGQSISFAASMVSHEAVTYQWRRNGQIVPGATGATLNLPAAAASDRGWYELAASNTLGTVRTRFRLEVALPNSTPVAWGLNLDQQATVPLGLGNIVAVEAGNDHSLALRGDGTVVAWGRNSSGQAVVPASLSNVVAISAGGSHSMALRGDGTVVTWGQGMGTTGGTLRDIVAISAGYNHCLAMRADGTVVAWGVASTTVLAVPSGLADVVDVAGGFAHSLALKADGTVVAWGGNTSGELNVPPGLANVIAVSTSGSHSLVLKADGTVLAWGSSGEPPPAGLNSVIRVSAGGTHGAALKADGTVVTWGTDMFGLTPVPSTAANAGALSARGAHYLVTVPVVGVSITSQPIGDTVAPGATVALTVAVAGTPPFGYQWKRNGITLVDGGRISGATAPTLTLTNAQEGDGGTYTVLIVNAGGDVVSDPAVVTVAPPPSFASRPLARLVSLGQPVTFTAEALGTGVTYLWRRNGQILAGVTGTSLSIPAASLADRGWYQLEATGSNGGKATTVFHLQVANQPATTRSVVGWGSNSHGQSNPPLSVGTVTAIAAGGLNSFALREDGTVVGWGWTQQQVSTPPPGLTGVVAIAPGYYHALALRSDGTVTGWGDPANNRTTVPATLRDVVAIAAGSDHNLALKGNGTVVAWGLDPLTFTPPLGLSGVIAVAAGWNHSLALKANGTVTAWGENAGGKATPPAGLSGVTAVAAGLGHSLALKSDGTVVGWGAGFGAPQTVPAGLAGVIAVFAGRDYSLALKSDGSVVAWGDNSSGQVTGASGLASVALAAAGGYHGLALVPFVSPAIAVAPQPVVATTGQSVTFNVSASGTPPFAYQWNRDGAPIAGATRASLTLSDVQESDTSMYTVTVTNGGGSVTSMPAALVVHGPPTAPILRAQSVSQGVVAGLPVSLSVTLAGSVPLTQQWYEGAAGDTTSPAPGMGAGTTLNLGIPTDSRVYWLRAANPAGIRDTRSIRVLPWAPRDPGLFTKNLNGASYANGDYFVVAPEGGAKSRDGITWTPIGGSFGGGVGSGIVFGNGRYVAGGGSTTQSVYTSTDGVAWTFRNSAITGVTKRVLFTGTRFVAVGGGISTSEDAVTWTQRYAPGVTFNDAATGNGVHIAVGESGRIARSTDGVLWSDVPAPTTRSFSHVVYGKGRFVALAWGAAREMWTSASGLDWTQISYPAYPATGANYPISPITYGGGVFVAVAGAHLLLSEDGLQWDVTPDFFTKQVTYPSSVAFGGGRFLFAGERGEVMLSLPLAGFPTITAQPAGTIVVTGQSAVLSVAATGPDLVYQWYRGPSGDTSQPVSGATGATFNTGALSANQSFWVRVSNAMAALDSVAVLAQVSIPPTIDVPEPERESVAGENVAYTALVTGTPAPTLQWYRGLVGDTSSPLSGQTSPALMRVAGTRAEFFWARASNLAGTRDGPQLRIVPWEQTQGGVYFVNVRQVGSEFLAVGGSDVLTSADARDWKARGFIPNAYLRDIASGGGLYVAVGERGFFTSTNLVDWTARNPPAESGSYNGASSIARGNGVFVAVGGGTFISSNGIDWTRPVLPQGISFHSVVFDGSRFVASGAVSVFEDATRSSVGVVFTSNDGSTWTRRAEDILPESQANAATLLDRIEVVNGRYVAVSSSAGFVAVSSDTLSWTRTPVPPVAGGRLRSIAYHAGRYILGTDTNGCLLSSDAHVWQPALGPEGMSAATLLTSDGQLYAFGTSGAVFSTTDAVTWTSRVFVPASMQSVAYGAGRFVGLALGGTYLSEDGVTWRRTMPDVSRSGSHKIAFANGVFTALSDEAGVVHQSRDGETWRRVRLSAATSYTTVAAANDRLLPLTGSQRDAAYGGGTYVIVGNELWRSSDGINWTSQLLQFGQYLNAVAYGNGVFVAVGTASGSGLVLTSTDGATWITRNFPASSNGVHDVVFTNGMFFVATSEGVAYSRDGIAWFLHTAMGRNLVCFAAANGRVFGYGLGTAAWVRTADGTAPTIRSITPPTQVNPGGTATLTVDAMGSGLTYQWFRGESGDGSQPLPGATSSVFGTGPVNVRQRFWVRVTGAGGIADSGSVLVWPAAAPTITVQPFSADLASTDMSFVTRVVVESVAPVTYQWYQGVRGNLLRPVAGAVTATLTMPPPPATTRYWVRVTSSLGSTDSEEVVITPWESSSLLVSGAAYASAGMAYGNGTFVVTGRKAADPTTGWVQRSPDGITWTTHSVPRLGAVVFGAGRFVATTLSPGNQLYHSTDGMAWTSVTLDPSGARFSNLVYTGSRFFALEASGRVAVSSDGQTWGVGTAGSNPLSVAAFGNGVYIVAGVASPPYRSADGSVWSAIDGTPLHDIRGLVFDGTKFLALTSDGVLMISVDGTHWTEGSVRTAEGWLNLKPGPGLAQAGGFVRGVMAYATASRYATADGSRWWPTLPDLGQCVVVAGRMFGANVTTRVTLTDSGSSLASVYNARFYRAIPEPELPIIITAPVAQSVYAGQSFTLTVTAAGPGVLGYQWRKDGVILPGRTNAVLVVTGSQVTDAGNYDVIVSNDKGDSVSPGAIVTVSPAIAPTITAQPTSLAVNAGEPASFSVVATGSPAPSFEWRRNSVSIPGATAATLALGPVQPSDGGLYTVAVTNPGGSLTSLPARLSVTPAGMLATHQVVDGGYVAGGTLTISNTLAAGTETADFKWDVLLPDGWSFASSTGEGESTKPTAGATGLLSWQWASLPPGSVTFNYIVNAPMSASGVQLAAALVTRTASAVSVEFLARPDPLAFVPNRHSADTDANGAVSLAELTRVIELYNTRNGTTRTGAYRRATASTEDGFAADLTRTEGQMPGFTGLHTADSSHSGTVDLFELTRVIQLYNHREGTVRTGRYRVQAGSEDGFAPGP